MNAEVHDWVIEPVVGNRLTHQIQELTLDTTYYFKIQARNSKGMGPMSEAVHFRTPKSECEEHLPAASAAVFAPVFTQLGTSTPCLAMLCDVMLCYAMQAF